MSPILGRAPFKPTPAPATAPRSPPLGPGPQRRRSAPRAGVVPPFRAGASSAPRGRCPARGSSRRFAGPRERRRTPPRDPRVRELVARLPQDAQHGQRLAPPVERRERGVARQKPEVCLCLGHRGNLLRDGGRRTLDSARASASAVLNRIKVHGGAMSPRFAAQERPCRAEKVKPLTPAPART